MKLRFDLALGRDGNVLFVGDGTSADVTRTRTSGGAAAKLSNFIVLNGVWGSVAETI